MSDSDLFEISYNPILNDLDENEIDYLIKFQKTPAGKKMFYFLSYDLKSLIGAEIV